MWSFLFFYQQQVGLALAEIILLWLVIATNGYLFYKINKTAGLLFVPYLLWVSFATYLTYAIYTLN
jgi:tryptophan-rich sensory protein